jgi:hypothetical protein
LSLRLSYWEVKLRTFSPLGPEPGCGSGGSQEGMCREGQQAGLEMTALVILQKCPGSGPVPLEPSHWTVRQLAAKTGTVTAGPG